MATAKESKVLAEQALTWLKTQPGVLFSGDFYTCARAILKVARGLFKRYACKPFLILTDIGGLERWVFVMREQNVRPTQYLTLSAGHDPLPMNLKDVCFVIAHPSTAERQCVADVQFSGIIVDQAHFLASESHPLAVVARDIMERQSCMRIFVTPRPFLTDVLDVRALLLQVCPYRTPSPHDLMHVINNGVLPSYLRSLGVLSAGTSSPFDIALAIPTYDIANVPKSPEELHLYLSSMRMITRYAARSCTEPQLTPSELQRIINQFTVHPAVAVLGMATVTSLAASRTALQTSTYDPLPEPDTVPEPLSILDSEPCSKWNALVHDLVSKNVRKSVVFVSHPAFVTMVAHHIKTGRPSCRVLTVTQQHSQQQLACACERLGEKSRTTVLVSCVPVSFFPDVTHVYYLQVTPLLLSCVLRCVRPSTARHLNVIFFAGTDGQGSRSLEHWYIARCMKAVRENRDFNEDDVANLFDEHLRRALAPKEASVNPPPPSAQEVPVATS